MSQSANDLQRGFSKWPVGSQELQAVAYLPPVGPNFPEGFLVLAPVGKDPELDCLAKASSPEQILEQKAELAASISRHVKEARAALTKLGWLNRGDCEMSVYQVRTLKAEMEANSPEAVAYGKAHEPAVEHWSDCSVHNEPAFPAGSCDCVGFKSGK